MSVLHSPHSLLFNVPPCRAYLKSVAKKLAEDVDNLKNTAGTMGRVSEQLVVAMVTNTCAIIVSIV